MEMGEATEAKIEEVMKKNFGRGIDQCTDDEVFQGLLMMTKEELSERKPVILQWEQEVWKWVRLWRPSWIS